MISTTTRKADITRDASGEMTSILVRDYIELRSDAKNTVTMQIHPDCSKKEIWKMLEAMTATAKAEYLAEISNTEKHLIDLKRDS